MFTKDTIHFSKSGGFAIEIKFINPDGSYAIFKHSKKGSFLNPIGGEFVYTEKQILEFLSR